MRTDGADEESVEFVRAQLWIVTPTADFLPSGDMICSVLALTCA